MRLPTLQIIKIMNMSKLIALVPILGTAIVLQAHTATVDIHEKPQQTIDRVYDIVEQMPQFPGGPQGMFRFLSETVKYPEKAKKAGLSGRVIVTFIVEKDGSISHPEITKGISEELDAEALRVVSAMPKWVPGRQNGKAVRVKYILPVTFFPN
jgi:TonB family protein